MIGAGPGSIDLLTVKAKEVISNADVIVHDAIIPINILNLAKKAIFFNAGLEGYANIKHQEMLAKILINQSSAHSTLVRLKSGDPFLFGNGGETYKFLKDEIRKNNLNIEIEIIPGISSAFAASSLLGLPLTLSGIEKSLAILSGHNDGKTHNYSKLNSFGTLIFYMAIKTINDHVNGLINEGFNPKTMVCIIEKGCHNDQRIFIGLLRETPALIENKSIQEPAVIIIGDCVAYFQKFIK